MLTAEQARQKDLERLTASCKKDLERIEFWIEVAIKNGFNNVRVWEIEDPEGVSKILKELGYTVIIESKDSITVKW